MFRGALQRALARKVRFMSQRVLAAFLITLTLVACGDDDTRPMDASVDSAAAPDAADAPGERCEVDERVQGGRCTPCAAGEVNDAGDDPVGVDTACDPVRCREDEHVVGHACEMCPGGSTNAAGDEASGGDTMCDAALCASDQAVNDGECVVCPPGTVNDAGDDPSGADTTCDVTFCEVNEFVSGNTCVACPAGTANEAGDDASGPDTRCVEADPCERALGLTCDDFDEAYIKASNTGASDQLSYGAALSADGTTLAVGAPGEASAATGVGGDQTSDAAPYSGAVYVFRRSGSVWAQEEYLKASNTGADDLFGESLALSSDGTILAVGAPSESSAATGVGGNQTNNRMDGAGAVYVFVRTDTTWEQQAYVKASNPGEINEFGGDVSLSADGGTLAVGAEGEQSAATGIDGDQDDESVNGAGAVYVFRRTGSTWAQEAYVKASNTNAGDRFGRVVALAADGATLAVSAPYEESAATGVDGDQMNNDAMRSGAVYVFGRTGSTWAQEAYIKSSNNGPGDTFGVSMALSASGEVLAVGAFSEDSEATGIDGDQASNGARDSGAAYLFRRDDSGWVQEAYVKASNAEADDHFGFRVALSSDGATLIVSAHEESSVAVGVNGDQTSNSAADSGAVYVFRRVDSVWSQRAYVKASNTEAGDQLGFQIALSSDGATMAMCARWEASSATGIDGDQENNDASASGAVYVRRLR